MSSEELLEEMRERYADEYFSEETLREFAAERELEEFLCSEIENFRRESISTKAELRKSVEETRARYQAEAASEERDHSDLFYQVLDDLLEKFKKELYGKNLPEPLNDWWSYSYTITDSGIKLSMDYYSWSHCFEGDFDCSRDGQIVLLEIPAKMLTVSEYAEVHGVAPVTVRQWIRRAKIRSAVKYGNEWRISELTELPKSKGYTSCHYIWKNTLIGLPDKFAYLNKFSGAYFSKDETGNDQYCVKFLFKAPSELGTLADLMGAGASEDEHKEIKKIFKRFPDSKLTQEGKLILSGKEREELELYMIGNPLVECLPADGWDDVAGRTYCDIYMSIKVND